MINWLRKKIGYHVHKYTKWEYKRANFIRLPNSNDCFAVYATGKEIEYTQQWQERKCKDCGFIQQAELI